VKIPKKMGEAGSSRTTSPDKTGNEIKL
jgi:hypothetical protein